MNGELNKETNSFLFYVFIILNPHLIVMFLDEQKKVVSTDLVIFFVKSQGGR